ncbi:transcriptional regulator UhpA [Salmonella enterica subsp. enterica]|nr:transcriptional regulator UhpA [Salmonella enterica subsp. enterica serovar Kentucky]
MITVALIDDHLIVRSGFAQLLGLEPDLQVVAEFGSGREALAGLPGRGVQVCICDISMPDISGLELLSQLPKGMATIMLSVHDSPALVEQALNAGARGFLSKRCSPDELIAAVHTVATGGCYLTPRYCRETGGGSARSADQTRASGGGKTRPGYGGKRDCRRAGAVAKNGACPSRESAGKIRRQQ